MVAQADAVLNALKNKTAARAKKKFVRPAWVSVGPSTLVPSDTEEEEKKAVEEQAGKKKKKKSSVEYLSDDLKDESEEEQEHGEDEEWNPNCQTPAAMVVARAASRRPRKQPRLRARYARRCSKSAWRVIRRATGGVPSLPLLYRERDKIPRAG